MFAKAVAATPMAPQPTFTPVHLPVMLDEVRALAAPVLGPGTLAVDCTLGRGGHTAMLLELGAEVIALDRDEAAIEAARERFGATSSLTLIHAPFSELSRVLREAGALHVQMIFADLGVSSPQLDVAKRGFSFQKAGPLEMRMDRSRGASLSEKLASVGADELATVLWRFGEERASRRIAKAILEAMGAGRLETTRALAEVVATAAGGRARRLRIHPATRTFQALRIWVNDELGQLDALLAALPGHLAPGGRAAILSFHSLEDRPVKHGFRALCRGCVCPPEFPACACGKTPRAKLLTRRAIAPSAVEVERNPRARSAHLRAIERIEALS